MLFRCALGISYRRARITYHMQYPGIVLTDTNSIDSYFEAFARHRFVHPDGPLFAFSSLKTAVRTDEAPSNTRCVEKIGDCSGPPHPCACHFTLRPCAHIARYMTARSRPYTLMRRDGSFSRYKTEHEFGKQGQTCFLRVRTRAYGVGKSTGGSRER